MAETGTQRSHLLGPIFSTLTSTQLFLPVPDKAGGREWSDTLLVCQDVPRYEHVVQLFTETEDTGRTYTRFVRCNSIPYSNVV